MYNSKEIKQDIFKKHGKSEKDTGSPEGQIAFFTHRIQHLSEHLKSNRKDFNTERSLVRLVGKRRSSCKQRPIRLVIEDLIAAVFGVRA